MINSSIGVYNLFTVNTAKLFIFWQSVSVQKWKQKFLKLWSNEEQAWARSLNGNTFPRRYDTRFLYHWFDMKMAILKKISFKFRYWDYKKFCFSNVNHPWTKNYQIMIVYKEIIIFPRILIWPQFAHINLAIYIT